jgi:serine/threonine-protein kinase
VQKPASGYDPAVSAPSDDADPKLGTTVAQRYRLDERLGAGGMGVVYRGVELDGERPVAIKFLHEAFAGIPDLVKRFDREVSALRRVKHPNLAAILDSGVQGGVPYLVMELHHGKSLADLIERGALPPKRAVALAREVLAGVSAAHACGVVHRDLKPDNILLDGDQVHILDFGLAKMVSGTDAGATQLTNTGLAMGTPGYMAPEQARGTTVDHRADLYSVGVILYHMVVGRKPFVSESAMAVMRMHMDDPPMPPRRAAPDAKLSIALERVILRALEKEPARRWPSADAFADALEQTPEAGGREVSIDDGETRLGKRAPRFSRWRIVSLTAQAIAFLAVCGGALYGWSKLSSSDRHSVEKKIDRAVDTAMDKAKDAIKVVTAPIQKAPAPLPPTPPPKAADDDDDDSDPTEPPSRDTPGAKLEESAPRAEPAKKPKLADAVKLINAGDLDEGIQLLYLLRRASPKSGAIALWLGHAYFRKLWRTDGLREYDDAIDWSKPLRRDSQLIRDSVAALDDPTYRHARALLRKKVGTAALPELRRAAKEGKNARVQVRAARLVAELSKQARRRR